MQTEILENFGLALSEVKGLNNTIHYIDTNSFLEKVISSSRAVKILFLSFTCEDIGVAMVTNMISQLQGSFRLRRIVFHVEVSSVSIK